MSFSESTIKNLIIKVRENDNESLLDLINKFKPYMVGLIKKYNIESSYEDILSELLEIIVFIDLNKNNVDWYIKSCLKNYCLKIMKKHKGYVSFDENLENILSSKDYYKDILDKDFNKDNLVIELSKVLNNKERDIFLSVYLNDISVEDLVQISNKSKSTIYRTLNISRNKVEKYLMGR
ncbi:MAG: sigma-70 family RNA polymerase sigma factor [Cetobacterium sp.]